MLPLVASVSILLVNWNGEAYLRKFLPVVIRATQYPDYQIYVVDNNSSDGSLAFLATEYPQVMIITNHQNDGFARGNNLALPYIESKYVLLLNTDVEVTPGWLTQLVALAETDANIAAVQPKIKAYHAPDYFEYAGGAGGWIDVYGYSFCRGRIFDTLETDTGQYDDPIPVFWASGACMLVRYSVIARIGLFDESFFAHWEEIDFCWRAQNYGYQIYAEPRSVVYHVGGGTLPAHSPRKSYLNFRNSLACIIKNLPWQQVIFRLCLRFLLDYIAFMRSCFKGEFRLAWSIPRAHIGFVSLLPRYIRERRKHPKKFIQLLHGVMPSSIIIQYFFQNLHFFQNLKVRR